jgi:hypothetical protein
VPHCFRTGTYSGDTATAYGTALGTIISHEIGHNAIPCLHNSFDSNSDCGSQRLMRAGAEQGSASFINPSFQFDHTQYEFTPQQAKAIQDRCKKLRSMGQKPRKGGGGGPGTHGGQDWFFFQPTYCNSERCVSYGGGWYPVPEPFCGFGWSCGPPKVN